MSYNTLQNYYATIFTLHRDHKYRTDEIENWHPFERDFNVDFIMQRLKEMEEANKANGSRR